MFLFWMLVSMMLPLAFFACFIAMAMVLMNHVEISATTIDRVRRKNPISPFEKYEPAPMTDARGNRTWESALEAEQQRLRRKSIGGFH